MGTGITALLDVVYQSIKMFLLVHGLSHVVMKAVMLSHTVIVTVTGEMARMASK